MRRQLMGALLGAILSGTTAYAAEPVIDATAIAKLQDELRVLQQQLTTMRQEYASIAHATNLGDILPGMDSAGIQSPLPTNNASIAPLLSGHGNLTGLFGLLNSLLPGQKATNQVYAVPQDSWLSGEIDAHGGGIAGAQATARDLYQANEDRLAELDTLQQQIDGADDQSLRESLIGRIGVEQAKISTQANQIAALQMFANAQARSDDQRQIEHTHENIDQQLCQGNAMGLWPTCPQQGPGT